MTKRLKLVFELRVIDKLQNAIRTSRPGSRLVAEAASTQPTVCAADVIGTYSC